MSVVEEIGTGLLPSVYITSVDIKLKEDIVSFNATLSVKDSLDENGKYYWTNTLIQNNATVTFLCVATNFEGQNSELIEDLNNGIILPMDVKVVGEGITKSTFALKKFVLDLDM